MRLISCVFQVLRFRQSGRITKRGYIFPLRQLFNASAFVPLETPSFRYPAWCSIFSCFSSLKMLLFAPGRPGGEHLGETGSRSLCNYAPFLRFFFVDPLCVSLIANPTRLQGWWLVVARPSTHRDRPADSPCQFSYSPHDPGPIPVDPSTEEEV